MEVDYQSWVRTVEREAFTAPEPNWLSGAVPRFSMAFQPIVNVVEGVPFAYEALVRSTAGEPAISVLSRVPKGSFHLFDKACRSRALELAIGAGLLNEPNAKLCINVNPNAAVGAESHLMQTCEEALMRGLPLDRLVVELVEDDAIIDFAELKHVVRDLRECGVRIAMDDFGAGYSGLKLLSKLQPDIIKLDMELVNRVEVDRTAEIIVQAIVQACFELNITTVAEGVETYETAMLLRDMGVVHQQGYYFARPAFEQLAPVVNCLPEMQIGAANRLPMIGARRVAA